MTNEELSEAISEWLGKADEDWSSEDLAAHINSVTRAPEMAAFIQEFLACYEGYEKALEPLVGKAKAIPAALEVSHE